MQRWVESVTAISLSKATRVQCVLIQLYSGQTVHNTGAFSPVIGVMCFSMLDIPVAPASVPLRAPWKAPHQLVTSLRKTHTHTQNPAFIPLHRLIHFLGTFPKPLPVFAKSLHSSPTKPNHWLQADIHVDFIVLKISAPQCDRAGGFMSPCTVSVIRARAWMQRGSAHTWPAAAPHFHTHVWHVTDVSRMWPDFTVNIFSCWGLCWHCWQPRTIFSGLSVESDADAEDVVAEDNKKKKNISFNFFEFSGVFFFPVCLCEEVICHRPSAVLSSPEPNFTKSSHFHKQRGIKWNLMPHRWTLSEGKWIHEIFRDVGTSSLT